MAEQTIQATYLPQIECEVEEGIAGWDSVVTVKDVNGRAQTLSVSKGMVNEENGRHYLPIGIVKVDYAQRRVLIELPSEADSGTSRLWAPFGSFRKG
jgi:hypothetical protein